MLTDETLLVEIDAEEDILLALEVLGGAALISGNRRLYEHIYRAKIQYDQGVNLHLTDRGL